MRFLVFLLLVSMCASGRPADTLLPRILKVQNDTERVNQLYQRGFKLRNSEPGISFQYAKLCEKAAIITRSEKHLAKSYNLLGILYYKKGSYRTALGYHAQALQLRQRCGDVNGIAHSQVNLGNVYAGLNLLEQAEAAYLSAIAAYRRSGNNKERIADCLLNIGTVKHQLKQYDAAIENYRLAEALTGLNDYNSKAIFLTNMAQAFAAKGDVEKCIACNEDALKLRAMADNNLEAADNYLNLAGAYLINKDFLKARYYLDTACYIATQYNYFELTYEACKTYALYYAQVRNFEAALYWQNRYSQLKDSLLAQQSVAIQLLDFNEINFEDSALPVRAGIQNIPLLLCIFSFLVLIPLSLLRFKR